MSDEKIAAAVHEAAEVVAAVIDTATQASDPAATASTSPVLDSGFLFAYTMLIVMAAVPIYIGCIRSVKDTKFKTEDVMTSKDAAMFPFIASGALFGLYLLFKFVGKEVINLILGAYFGLVGVLSLTTAIRPLLLLVTPKAMVAQPFRVLFSQEPTADAAAAPATTAVTTSPTPAVASSSANSTATAPAAAKSTAFVDFTFDYVDVACFVVSLAVGGLYVYTKHWLANNLFGIAFAITGIELLPIGSFTVASIMLVGLFVYDIFWVFGTDVMVTVAKSFDAPIKVVFPKDFFEHGIFANKCAMLGLGDIVIPGVLIALLLRFDRTRGDSKSRLYFLATLAAYVAGLLVTVTVMHVFNAAQPALLYLVPACLGTPALLALARGEFRQLVSYSDEHEKKD